MGVEKLDENPYISHITLIDQTVQFCKGLLPKEEEEAKEEKKETVHTNKEGEVVLGKKEDRANEFYFAPTKKKGGAKKANKPAEEKTKKTIKHNAETFKLFDSLGLEAPITVADVPPLLEKLEKQTELYQDKVQAWEDQKEEMRRKILDGQITYDQLAKGDRKEEQEEE